MLNHPIYFGRFLWRGEMFEGKHETFISPELYRRVQAVLSGHNKPKYGKHALAFRGMLTCAHDNCAVTELKKGKYVYYRCTGHCGPCTLPRFREEEISQRLGHVLRDVTIPTEVARQIEASLLQVQTQMRKQSTQERTRLERELAQIRLRMDAAYMDKFDGKITDDFWQREQADWQREEWRIESLISGKEETRRGEKLLTMRRILELAQNAHSL